MRQRIVDLAAMVVLVTVGIAVRFCVVITAEKPQARFIGCVSVIGICSFLGFLCSIVVVGICIVGKIYINDYLFYIFGIIYFVLIYGSLLTLLFHSRSLTVDLHRPGQSGFSSHLYAIKAIKSGPLWLEIEGLRAAGQLLSRLHPLMSRSHAASLRDDLELRFAELEADPSMHDFPDGPALTPYRILHDPDHRHFFAYVPEHDPDERLPLLIALHGHGPNALIWLASWKPLADRLGLIVVSPSFGYGQWEHRDSTECLRRTVAVVREHYPVDGRLFVAGISQGGCGVTRAGLALQPNGLIFLSPTMEPNLLIAPTVPRVPVLVFQGGADVNVRPKSVDTAVELLKSSGFDVDYHRIDDEDHYLRFRSQAVVDEAIAAWFGKLLVS